MLLETFTELEGLFCKPKYRENLFKYILLVLAILFFVTFAVRICLPSVFCILDNLLIQVYKRSGNHSSVCRCGIANFNSILHPWDYPLCSREREKNSLKSSYIVR